MSDVQPRIDLLGAIVDRHAEKGYLHRDEVEPNFKGAPRTPKPRRALPRLGKKARQDRKELRAAMKIVRARSHGHCEMTIDHDCTRIADHPHHIQRRGQGGSNDPENILHVCFAGHRWIHDNVRQARFVGYLA